jgi:ABC-2 type transport system permease protein
MTEPFEPSLSTARAVGLVARREIRTRFASRAFRIMTVVMVLGVVAFILVLKFTGHHSGSKIAMTAGTASLAQPVQSLAAAVGEQVTVSTVDDQAAAEQQVRDGKLDVLVVGTPTSFQVVVNKSLAPGLTNVFTVLNRQIVFSQQITQLGGDPAAVSAAVDKATVDVRALNPPKQYQVERLILGVIVGILVYATLVIYGQFVAQGVVEEKSSRIVELLLTTIRPWQLLLGKVAGIGFVGLVQLALIAAVGLGLGLRTHTLSFPADLALGIAVWGIVWFLLGYFVYALLFAALGALVSRQEDVTGVVTPVIMLLVIPYILGISILPADPDNKFMAWLSMVPLFSPTLMPVRIAMGAAPVWQAALATVLTVGLIALLIWLAGRIYANAVLRTGARVKLREALRAGAN